MNKFAFDLDLISDKNFYIKHELDKNNEIVLTVLKKNLIALLKFLRDDEHSRFKILADICGIDYLYNSEYDSRFCLVYNLLSIKFNKRIFIKVFTNDFESEPENYSMNYTEDELKDEKGMFQEKFDKTTSFKCEKNICFVQNIASKMHDSTETLNSSEKKNNFKNELDSDYGIPSVFEIFSSAFWLEREIYDMFGIKFSNMKDERRLLNDYGFKGFPLRKDFPLSGYKEVYYDASQQKVLYKELELDSEYRNFDFESSWQGPEMQKIFNEKIKQMKKTSEN
jgi:NADH-quinone oxidoreductase subunit C